MAERRLSFRDLSLITNGIALDRKEKGLGRAYLSNVVQGREHPNRRAIELIAEALGLRPETIPEYRLALLRDRLDPKRNAAALDEFLQFERSSLSRQPRDPLSHELRAVADRAAASQT
jgi:hypothetical protein